MFIFPPLRFCFVSIDLIESKRNEMKKNHRFFSAFCPLLNNEQKKSQTSSDIILGQVGSFIYFFFCCCCCCCCLNAECFLLSLSLYSVPISISFSYYLFILFKINVFNGKKKKKFKCGHYTDIQTHRKNKLIFSLSLYPNHHYRYCRFFSFQLCFCLGWQIERKNNGPKKKNSSRYLHTNEWKERVNLFVCFVVVFFLRFRLQIKIFRELKTKKKSKNFSMNKNQIRLFNEMIKKEKMSPEKENWSFFPFYQLVDWFFFSFH